MLPLPWPVVSVVKVTHAADAVTLHVQSRVVTTLSVFDPPSAGIAALSAFWSETSHFTSAGATTLTELDVHDAIQREQASTSGSAVRIGASGRMQMRRPQQGIPDLGCLAEDDRGGSGLAGAASADRMTWVR